MLPETFINTQTWSNFRNNSGEVVESTSYQVGGESAEGIFGFKRNLETTFTSQTKGNYLTSQK